MTYVLIVDDHALVREALELALQGAGFATDTAAHGKDALAKALERSPALILLDILMGEMDGLTMLREVRATPRLAETPVIVLTAINDPRLHEHASRLKVHHVVHKPVCKLPDLLKRIAEVVQVNPTESPRVQATVSNGSQRAAVDPRPAPPPAPPATARLSIQSSAALSAEELVKDLKPIITRTELMALVGKCEELPSLSPAASEVLKLTSSTRCSLEQVAQAISRDHAIALKILKLANSAVYARGAAVDSVHKAVLRIGLGQIRQAVLNLTVVDRFASSGLEGYIDPRQFWEHGISTGLIAAMLCEGRPEKDVDAAFTLGLLHDVGRMVLAAQLGERYREVLRAASELNVPLEMVERRMLCANHAEIMDRVLRAWGFSKHLINPIAFHHLPASALRQTIPNDAPQAAIVAYADCLSHAFMLGSSGNDHISSGVEYADVFKLADSALDRVEATAREQTEAVKLALLANAAQSPWPQLRETHRAKLKGVFRPLFVSARLRIDAVRILCQQLSAADTQPGPPTVGIVHIAEARERAELSRLYSEHERAARCPALPLIVLSPNGRLDLDPAVMADRHVRQLPVSIPISQLIDAVNELFESAVALVATAA